MPAADGAVGRPDSEVIQVHDLPKSVDKERTEQQVDHIDHVPEVATNLVYDDNDEEPELHFRTYFALAAMFLLNLVQVFALQGPPAVVCMTVPTSTELTDHVQSFLLSGKISRM